MWPGQQPPGGEQNPQDQNPNPYQQPGYQQPNPYQQPGYQQQPHSGSFSQPEQPQWAAPTPPPMPPQPGGGQGGDGNKTRITAIVAALAVLVAAGVTGFLVLGGDKDDEAKAKPEKSSSKKPDPSPTDDGGGERGPNTKLKPTVEGWNVVVNPKWGTAFDVPPDWAVQSADTFVAFEDAEKGDGSQLITMSAPAILKEKWCSYDDDKDGQDDDTSLAAVGTKGQNGAKNTKDVARNDSAWWVFGGYTGQKKADKKRIKVGKVESYTTKSGVKGSVATSTTSGVVKEDKCDSDGKATTFAFKNADGEFVAWTLFGAKGVKDEVSDALVKKILDTVRLHKDPTGS